MWALHNFLVQRAKLQHVELFLTAFGTSGSPVLNRVKDTERWHKTIWRSRELQLSLPNAVNSEWYRRLVNASVSPKQLGLFLKEQKAHSVTVFHLWLFGNPERILDPNGANSSSPGCREGAQVCFQCMESPFPTALAFAQSGQRPQVQEMWSNNGSTTERA